MNSLGAKRRSNRHLKSNKRLRKFAIVTPWKDEFELEAVGRALLSVVESSIASESDEGYFQMPIEQAFEIVAVWKARSSALEGLPHSVEATFNLARLYWIDNIQKGSSFMSVTELRLAYSSAIVRTINGFADRLQQQRFMAASVSVLCEQLGIPAWIVDIRHEASHNALPTLGVLRLATTTLLEFLKNEFWIPTCRNWKQNTDVKNLPQKEAIDFLLHYKTNATSYFSSSGESAGNNRKNLTISKKKSSKPVVTILPIDPLFPDSDDSSDDDDWEDPIMGSVWGSSIGTNINRFAILETTKKSKKDKKKKGKATPKKKSNEKHPVDFAKDFVEAVSPEEGIASSIMFLVWGGIGGAPSGRGVLIPGSTVAFPATPEGVTKSWQRYGPLIQVLGRFWPGFCSSLLVHLVDFALSIEDTVVTNNVLDPGSARKLYFLSAWIRFMLSKQFIVSIDPEYTSKTSNRKNGSIELTLAELPYLEKFGYPLNSICDRCCQFTDNIDLRKTSHDVLESIETILGKKRCQNSGIVDNDPQAIRDGVTEGPALKDDLVVNNDTKVGEAQTPQVKGHCMSLDDIEAMLSDDGDDEEAPESNVEKEKYQEKPCPQSKEESIQFETENPLVYQKHDEDKNSNKRSAWVRCASWDPCSIGSLPGYPA